MSTQKKNRYGISRDIGAPNKKIIRKRDGFGCVLCGNLFVVYAHIDPPYKDAESHNLNQITLLCPDHHNDLDIRKTISKQFVKKAMKNPHCLKEGYSKTHWKDISSDKFSVLLGSLRFHLTREADQEECNLVTISGEKMFTIKAPEEEGGPLRISARFFDKEGNSTLEIEDNEVMVSSGIWDFQVKGNKYTLCRGNRDIALQFRFCAPDGLVIERLDMFYQGTSIKVDKNNVEFNGSGGKVKFLGEVVFTGFSTCIVVDKDGIILGDHKRADDEIFSNVKTTLSMCSYKSGMRVENDSNIEFKTCFFQGSASVDNSSILTLSGGTVFSSPTK